MARKSDILSRIAENRKRYPRQNFQRIAQSFRHFQTTIGRKKDLSPAECRYAIVHLVSHVEAYFRQACIDLVNHGEPLDIAQLHWLRIKK